MCARQYLVRRTHFFFSMSLYGLRSKIILKKKKKSVIEIPTVLKAARMVPQHPSCSCQWIDSSEWWSGAASSWRCPSLVNAHPRFPGSSFNRTHVLTAPHTENKMTTRSEREKAQKLNEQHQAILTKLLKEENNKYCADCEAKGKQGSEIRGIHGEIIICYCCTALLSCMPQPDVIFISLLFITYFNTPIYLYLQHKKVKPFFFILLSRQD